MPIGKMNLLLPGVGLPGSCRRIAVSRMPSVVIANRLMRSNPSRISANLPISFATIPRRNHGGSGMLASVSNFVDALKFIDPLEAKRGEDALDALDQEVPEVPAESRAVLARAQISPAQENRLQLISHDDDRKLPLKLNITYEPK